MLKGNTFRRSFVLALCVVRRNWRVYRQSFFSNIAPTVTEPLLFMLSFGLGLGFYLSDVEGQSYVSFMAPGLAMASAMLTAIFETSYNFYIRYTYEKVYTALLTTPLHLFELILGEYIWLALKGAVMSTGVTVTFICFGFVGWEGLYWIPFAGALVALACGALGFIASTIISNMNQFQTVYALLISPMFFFSGVFFPVGRLPEVLQWATELSPLFHGVRIAQMALWNEIQWLELMSRFFVLAGFFGLLGLVSYRRVSRMLYH